VSAGPNARATGRRVWAALFALLALLAAAAPLAACGKRGSLEPPPGEPSDYPKKYPHD
jgi:predicted small lipoprotein YifL